MQFKRTAVRTIIASRNLAPAAGQAKTALISARAGPARSPAAARAIAPLSVLSGLKSLPNATRASSAVGIGKQILVIALLGFGIAKLFCGNESSGKSVSQCLDPASVGF
jgi:hypothetical protein